MPPGHGELVNRIGLSLCYLGLNISYITSEDVILSCGH